MDHLHTPAALVPICRDVFLSFSRGRRSLYTEVFYEAASVHLQIWDRATMRYRGRILKLGRVDILMLLVRQTLESSGKLTNVPQTV